MALTTATLSGPASGTCGIASTNFTVDLDDSAGPGDLTVTITSSVGGDTITPSPLVITPGFNFGSFTLTPSSSGPRDISITTTPALTIAGSPVTYTALTACPDDGGGTAQAANWDFVSLTCPPTLGIVVSLTPSTAEAIDLYGTTGTLTLHFTP